MENDHYVEWIRNEEKHVSGMMTGEKARQHFRRVRSLADTTKTYLVRQHGDEIVDSYERPVPAPGCGPESLVGAVPYPPDTPSEAELAGMSRAERLMLPSDRDIDEIGPREPEREPESAYAGALAQSQDLIQRLMEVIHDLPAPDSGYVRWDHVKLMNEVNLSLFTVIDFVQKGNVGCGT